MENWAKNIFWEKIEKIRKVRRSKYGNGKMTGKPRWFDLILRNIPKFQKSWKSFAKPKLVKPARCFWKNILSMLLSSRCSSESAYKPQVTHLHMRNPRHLRGPAVKFLVLPVVDVLWNAVHELAGVFSIFGNHFPIKFYSYWSFPTVYGPLSHRMLFLRSGPLVRFFYLGIGHKHASFSFRDQAIQC